MWLRYKKNNKSISCLTEYINTCKILIALLYYQIVIKPE